MGIFEVQPASAPDSDLKSHAWSASMIDLVMKSSVRLGHYLTMQVPDGSWVFRII